MYSNNCINVFFLLFYRPHKTDKCDTCTELQQSMKIRPDDKVQLQAELDAHLAEANIQVQHLKNREVSCPVEAKNVHSTWITIATDLQQTQPVPRLNNQSAFYKKKVSFPIRFVLF